jgi:hypothetical protein
LICRDGSAPFESFDVRKLYLLFGFTATNYIHKPEGGGGSDGETLDLVLFEEAENVPYGKKAFKL